MKLFSILSAKDPAKVLKTKNFLGLHVQMPVCEDFSVLGSRREIKLELHTDIRQVKK